MRRITTLLLAAGAAAGIGSVGTATPADAGGWCPPAVYTVVYYGPRVCCPAYAHGYFPYYKTTQYWPVVRAYRPTRVKLYGPIRSRR